MYFGCVCFRGELGFPNCDDICMCVFILTAIHFQYMGIHITSNHNMIICYGSLLPSCSLPDLGLCYLKSCSCTASCMPHIGSSILQIDQECSGFYTPLEYIAPMLHIWLRQTSRCSVVVVVRLRSWFVSV